MSELSPVAQKFVLHWGELGTRWGINRSVAQIHALLYISPQPLSADQIAGTLGLARSNVSTSLRELTGWGLARVSHKLGDRRDYFHTIDDVWELFHVVMAERKHREWDPTIAVLRECVQEANERNEDVFLRTRLGNMLDLTETLSVCYEELCKLPRSF